MADEKKEEKKEEATPDDTGQKSRKTKLIIMIVVGVVVLVGGGVGAMLMLMSSGKGKESPPAEQATEEHGDKGKKGHGEAKKEGEEKGHGEAKKEGEEGKKEGDHKEAAGGKAGEKAAKTEEVQINFGATHVFKPFHLNLGNPLENRYIRLEIALEYKNGPEQLKEIQAREPQLRDAVLSVASRKTSEFLLGPDGKDQLRLEILNKVNQYMDRKIEAIYITDMIIE